MATFENHILQTSPPVIKSQNILNEDKFIYYPFLCGCFSHIVPHVNRQRKSVRRLEVVYLCPERKFLFSLVFCRRVIRIMNFSAVFMKFIAII